MMAQALAANGAPGLQPEETLAFLMRLRGLGIGDTGLLRAFETVPRALFVPAAYRDLASQDIALPIGCGQSVSAPSDIAAALAALRPTPQSRVVEIGSGSGYAAALLARLAAEVTTIERFRTLAIEAATRLQALGATRVKVLHADGLAAARAVGGFDRLFIDMSVPVPPEALLARLDVGGICVHGRRTERGSRIMRLEKLADGRWREEDCGPARFDPAIAGRSRFL